MTIPVLASAVFRTRRPPSYRQPSSILAVHPSTDKSSCRSSYVPSSRPAVLHSCRFQKKGVLCFRTFLIPVCHLLMCGGFLVKKGAVFALVIFFALSVYAREPCASYCQGDVYYTGALNERTSVCDYTRELCELGCDGGCVTPSREQEETVPVHETVSREQPEAAPVSLPRTVPAQRVSRQVSVPPPVAIPKVITPSVSVLPSAIVPQIRAPFTPSIGRPIIDENQIVLDPKKTVTVASDEKAVSVKEEGGVVSVTVSRPAKLFGIFPTTVQITKTMRPGSLEVLNEKLPWWVFFAIIPKVEHSYGCMTVNDCLNNPAVNHCKEISCVMGSSVFGVCVESGVELDCGKADVCAKYACEPSTGKCGLHNLPDKTACPAQFDSYPCVEWECEAGSCESKWVLGKKLQNGQTCKCVDDKDCGEFEDGDHCNGKLYCDFASGQCLINPATIVACPKNYNECVKIGCDKTNGSCQKNSLVGSSCATGHPCWTGTCTAQGACSSVFDKSKKTSKGLPCECQSDSECPDDGNVCNGIFFCNKATNQCMLNPATIITCPSVDDAACVQNTCDPKSGKCKMVPVKEDESCGEWGCYNSTCKKGQCVLDWNYKCDCEKDADCKDDGDLCNGVSYCNKQTGKCVLNPATTITCQTVFDTACQKNTCDPKTGLCGMKDVNENGACSFEHFCLDSACQKGKCVTAWDYKKVSESKKCECKENSDCKDDGNVCNGVPYCNKQTNQCVNNPATLVYCPSVDDNECQKNTCNQATGKCSMQFINQNASCTQVHPCMSAACSQSECVQNWQYNKTAIGHKCQCKNNSDCAAYEDGVSCNGKLYCDLSKTECVINPATISC